MGQGNDSNYQLNGKHVQKNTPREFKFSSSYKIKRAIRVCDNAVLL